MSWLPSWLLSGIDTGEEQKRGDQLDAQLAALNKAALDEGKYDQSWYDQAQAHVASGRVADVDQEVTNAFSQGLDEGASNIRHGIGATIGEPFKLAFKIIPWQLWAIGLVVLFFYMGGGIWVTRQLKGRFA